MKNPTAWTPGQPIRTEADREAWQEWRAESKRQAQRDRRAKNPRVDYYPSARVRQAIEDQRHDHAGSDLSSIINRMIEGWLDAECHRNKTAGKKAEEGGLLRSTRAGVREPGEHQSGDDLVMPAPEGRRELVRFAEQYARAHEEPAPAEIPEKPAFAPAPAMLANVGTKPATWPYGTPTTTVPPRLSDHAIMDD